MNNSNPITYNVFINGYGAPQDILKDNNYAIYLSSIKTFLFEQTEIQRCGFNLYLAGGFTNRTDMSEAQAMFNWFEKNGFPENTQNVFVLEASTTARSNIEEMDRQIEKDEFSETLFFCEYTRRFQTKFFVRNIFHNRKRDTRVLGVNFDKKSLQFLQYTKTIFLRFPLLVLSYYFPLVDEKIVKPARARHVKKCRKKMV